MTNEDLLFISDFTWKLSESKSHYYYDAELSPTLFLQLYRSKESGAKWLVHMILDECSMEIPIKPQQDVNLLVKEVDEYVAKNSAL